MAPSPVSGAIADASDRTGVDFAYLLQQAKAESSFNPSAKAKTSSASGLFQFIESTWMGMINKYGAKHGLNTDGKTRGEILDLRNDPRAASLMAAEFASENEKFLKTHTKNVDIGPTELYFAHFLGAGQAASFLNARAENGMQEAAYLFPRAAKANYNVFYDKNTGKAKSLDEVYAFFERKFELEGAVPTELKPKPAESVVRTASTGSLYQLASAKPSLNFGSGRSLYQDLMFNSLDILLLTEAMGNPSSAKTNKFDLFSAHSILK